MNENLTKICRICLTEGSRHIFHKTVTHDALYNVSSLNRISEKLRFVTLLKIDEMENLPPMICDLCIVQLNVAYNFKRQATESDTKLRQYLIENGIDIMKDIRSLPAIRPVGQLSAPEGTLPVLNRTNHRINSASSSSVFEVPTNRSGVTTNGPPLEPRLVPIRIKVETPETVEQSSEPGDLLSNSTISPLSTITLATGIAPVAVPSNDTMDKTSSSEHIVVESSPASSKGTLSSNGRDSAMVVVDSRNINLQGDEDYVQNILGSNSSLTVEKLETNTAQPSKKVNVVPHKDKHSSPDQNESSQERRLKHLLSSLRINMVTNARFPQSKLRIKPRKKLQKLKQKQQAKTNAAPAKTNTTPTQKLPQKIARRHSLDLAQLLNGARVKKEPTPKATLGKKSPKKKSHVISPNKLRSLRDMIREERDLQQKKAKSKKQTEPEAKRRISDTSPPAGGQKAHDDRTKTVS